MAVVLILGLEELVIWDMEVLIGIILFFLIQLDFKKVCP